MIQRLLKEFDLDGCMQSYRSMYRAEHRVDPKDLSLERSVILP